MKLSDAEITVRDELRAKLAGDLEHLKHLGLLPADGGFPNYLPHKWDAEDLDPETGKMVERTLVDGERDLRRSARSRRSPKAEHKGAKPTTKDAIALISDYHERGSYVIAKDNLVEKLAALTMNEGAPMAAPEAPLPGVYAPA